MRLFANILAIVLLVSGSFAQIPYPGEPNMQQPKKLSGHGKTYEIVEPDAWETILKKSEEFNATKVATLLDQAYRKKFHIRSYLPECTKRRTYEYDPTYTVQRDIYLYGRLLAKKGQKINPLSYGIYHPIMLLPIRNAREKDAASKVWEEYPNALVMVVQGGDEAFFQENFGKVASISIPLIQKLGIRCYPAFVSVNSKKKTLVIKEIPFKEYVRIYIGGDQ